MAPEAGGLGARLRAGREKLGLTVLQTAERIHVDPKVVEYIEADDLVALGAPVYARGHIRHYAELVGESVAQLQEIYTNTAHASQPDLTQIAKVPPASSSSKLVAPALLVIAVFAIAGAVWWVSSLSAKKPAGSDVNVVGPVTQSGDSNPGAGGGGVPETAGTGSGAAADGAASGAAQNSRPATGSPSDTTPTAPNGQPAAAAPAGTMAMQPRPGATNRSGTSASSGPPASDGHSNTASGVSPVPSHTGPPGIHFAQAAASAAAAAASTASPHGGAKSSPSAPGTNSGTAASNSPPPRNAHETQVTLHYSADSWTEVYDATGERLFYDVGAANSVRTVSGKAPLTVVLANASGVAVEVNGHSAPLAKLSRPDGTAQFSVSRAGRLSRAKPSANGG
jgi:cytoskeleton protein RodZ